MDFKADIANRQCGLIKLEILIVFIVYLPADTVYGLKLFKHIFYLGRTNNWGKSFLPDFLCQRCNDNNLLVILYFVNIEFHNSAVSTYIEINDPIMSVKIQNIKPHNFCIITSGTFMNHSNLTGNTVNEYKKISLWQNGWYLGSY